MGHGSRYCDRRLSGDDQQVQDRELSFRNWTLPICATHIGFPCLWLLRSLGPWAGLPMAASNPGFHRLRTGCPVCVRSHLQFRRQEPIFGISSWVSNAIGLDENDTRRIIAILAVSWDALWSGPAKAEQSQRRKLDQLGSVCVLCHRRRCGRYGRPDCTDVRSQAARKAVRRRLSDGKMELQRQDCRAFRHRWLRVLSLLGGFAISESIWLSIVIAAVVVFLTFQLLEKSIMTEEMEAAEEAIFGETDDTDHAAA